MNRGGAPVGNKNASKGKPWTDAINRSLARFEATNNAGELRKGLDAIADRVVMLAAAGDKDAYCEIAQRVEGKVAQRIEATGADGGPIEFAGAESEFVRRRLVEIASGVEAQRDPAEADRG